MTVIEILVSLANQGLLINYLFFEILKWLMKMTGLYEFLPSNELMEFLGQTLCHQNSSMNVICSNVLFLIGGYNPDQLDQVE